MFIVLKLQTTIFFVAVFVNVAHISICDSNWATANDKKNTRIHDCSSGDRECCYNYVKSNDGTCIPCPPGTFGENCSASCPIGYYGQFCEFKCECQDGQVCAPSIGCICTNCTLENELGRINSLHFFTILGLLSAVCIFVFIGASLYLCKRTNKCKTSREPTESYPGQPELQRPGNTVSRGVDLVSTSRHEVSALDNVHHRSIHNRTNLPVQLKQMVGSSSQENYFHSLKTYPKSPETGNNRNLVPIRFHENDPTYEQIPSTGNSGGNNLSFDWYDTVETQNHYANAAKHCTTLPTSVFSPNEGDSQRDLYSRYSFAANTNN